jgi:hypothetical protein
MACTTGRPVPNCCSQVGECERALEALRNAPPPPPAARSPSDEVLLARLRADADSAASALAEAETASRDRAHASEYEASHQSASEAAAAEAELVAARAALRRAAPIETVPIDHDCNSALANLTGVAQGHRLLVYHPTRMVQACLKSLKVAFSFTITMPFRNVTQTSQASHRAVSVRRL